MDDRMGAVLVQAGKISQKQLDAALAAERETGGGSTASCSASATCTTRAGRLPVQALRRSGGRPANEDDPAVKISPPSCAQVHRAPDLESCRAPTVATTDPTNVFALDDIKFMTGYTVEPVVAFEEALGTASTASTARPAPWSSRR